MLPVSAVEEAKHEYKFNMDSKTQLILKLHWPKVSWKKKLILNKNRICIDIGDIVGKYVYSRIYHCVNWTYNANALKLSTLLPYGLKFSQ